MLELSRQHQQTLRRDPLAPEVQQQFEQMARDSLAEQARLEAEDDTPFEQFLADYLRS